MKPSDKNELFSVRMHACLAILAVTWLVGFQGYRIFLFPVIFIGGIGDGGRPSHESQMFGKSLLAVSGFIVFCIFMFCMWLFVRLMRDKTKSVVVRMTLITGLLLVFCGNFFAAWKANAGNRAYAAMNNDDVSAYEVAAKWSESVDVDSNLYHAARFGKLKMVQYLISKGANPNAMIVQVNQSVLDGAYDGGLSLPDRNKPVIEFLKNHGATNFNEEVKKLYESFP